MTEAAQADKSRSEPARETSRNGRGRHSGHAGSNAAGHPAASLQRAAGNQAVNALLVSGGQPLSPTPRHDFEERFSADFSGVRIHDTPRAADAAKGLGARAFTVGPHIAFDSGRFAPDTRDGKQLLAHELSHVIQQSRGGTTPPSLDGTGPLEAEATRASDVATGGGPAAVSGAGAVGVAAAPDRERPKPDQVDQPASATGAATDPALPRPMSNEEMIAMADKDPIRVEGKALHQYDDVLSAANRSLIDLNTPAEFERQMRFRVADGSTEFADSWTQQERFEYAEFPDDQAQVNQSKWDQYVQQRYMSYLSGRATEWEDATTRMDRAARVGNAIGKYTLLGIGAIAAAPAIIELGPLELAKRFAIGKVLAAQTSSGGSEGMGAIVDIGGNMIPSSGTPIGGLGLSSSPGVPGLAPELPEAVPSVPAGEPVPAASGGQVSASPVAASPSAVAPGATSPAIEPTGPGVTVAADTAPIAPKVEPPTVAPTVARAPVELPAAGPSAADTPASQAAAPTPAAEAPVSRRSTRLATSDESFGDAEFDAIAHDARNSDFGARLEAGKRRPPAAIAEDTTRTRAEVDSAAHAAARRNPPPGRVPGAQIQHQTKTLDVTRNLPPALNPPTVATINENTLWLQSRKNLPSTTLHIDPNGGGTRIYVDKLKQGIPRGRIGDSGMPGEQLDLFEASPGKVDPTYNTEHKFVDNSQIPDISEQIATSRENAGLPPLDPRMQAISAGEQSRWALTGESGSSRSGEVIDIAGQASARPVPVMPPSAPSAPSPQLELPFNPPPSTSVALASASPEAAPTPPAPETAATDPAGAPPKSEGGPPAAPAHPPPSLDIPPEPSGTGPAAREPRSTATPPEPQATGTLASGAPEPAPASPHTPSREPPGSRPAPPEEPPPSSRSTGKEPGAGDLAHAGTQALNEAAALVPTVDTYDEARERGASAPGAALAAGKTYLENTNIVAGAIANYRAKQKDGQDPIEAALSTGGEMLAGLVVPGNKLDQAINAGANLTDAVDDHLKRGDPKAATEDKANARTGADFAAGLTPSRMFSGLIGGGLRSYWNIGKAIGGDTTGVDKFGDDAVKGKIAMVIQPWAMAADFLGNLGSGEGAAKALDKTMAKTKGSTLDKVGGAGGDGLYNLGQSDAAKSGRYGGEVQALSIVLSATSDHIAGKSWSNAFERAAAPGKDTALILTARAGVALASAAGEKYDEVTRKDIPAMRAAVREKLDEAKSVVGAFEDKATDTARQYKAAAADKWQSLKTNAAHYLPSW